MKNTLSSSIFISTVAETLAKTKSAKALASALEHQLHEAYKEVPAASRYKVALVETESLRYSHFYQSGPRLSKHAVSISGPGYASFIWRDEPYWSLDDDCSNPSEIAHQLAGAPLFSQYPENVKDLEYLLKQGIWLYSPKDFPVFSDSAPLDKDEVLSWDDKHVLIGTQYDNMAIVTRAEWDKITFHEKNWFNGKDG